MADPVPVTMRRDGDSLSIEWSDGLRAAIPWTRLRDACPCAGCKEEQGKPADPFRLLKPAELVPLAAVSMPRIGHYAYKIVWSDGHDAGIFTLTHLRQLSLDAQ